MFVSKDHWAEMPTYITDFFFFCNKPAGRCCEKERIERQLHLQKLFRNVVCDNIWQKFELCEQEQAFYLQIWVLINRLWFKKHNKIVKDIVLFVIKPLSLNFRLKCHWMEFSSANKFLLRNTFSLCFSLYLLYYSLIYTVHMSSDRKVTVLSDSNCTVR